MGSTAGRLGCTIYGLSYVYDDRRSSVTMRYDILNMFLAQGGPAEEFEPLVWFVLGFLMVSAVCFFLCVRDWFWYNKVRSSRNDPAKSPPESGQVHALNYISRGIRPKRSYIPPLRRR